MAGFQFVSPDIAVDIGTDNTRVYVKEKGIVVNEPSVVITRGEGPKNIVAVGDSAEEMIGRAGGNIRIIHPLRDGVIVDYEMAQIMIHYFVSKAIGTRRFVSAARGCDNAGRRQQSGTPGSDQYNGKDWRASDFRG